MSTNEAATSPYSVLLNGARGRDSRIKNRDLTEEVFADRGRVIFSAPFRRTQNKAQVFSLERNASVRSRLTHSLEVSSIGRFIAQRVVMALRKGSEVRQPIELDESFITFVEVACLLHDIGNPPFGHFGEKAIRKWFADRRGQFETLLVKDYGDKARKEFLDAYCDFTLFDGNPQGLRLISRLQPHWEGDRFGLNLTVTTMASIIKYPWIAADAVNMPKSDKVGFFSTEADLYKKIQTELHLDPQQRHPIVYLVEAADDIAYCLSDIEDGLEKGIVTLEQLREHLEKAWANAPELKPIILTITPPYASILSGDDEHAVIEAAPKPFMTPMIEFRGGVVRLLTDRAARRYIDEHDRFLAGEFIELIDKSSVAGTLMRGLKSFAHNLYNSPIVRSRELTAFKVLHGILDAHEDILTCTRKRFEEALEGRTVDSNDVPITVEASLLSRMSRNAVLAYKAALAEMGSDKAGREWIHRTHMITDYVGGMTDEHALECYQLISGMKIDPRL
jgi:dGTPase